MATTPNFNWATPDNTGLVKNGALDIRTLGNSIDASMADLKGGTTGQVLAKASNTDMDFVWAADAGAPTSLGFAAGKNKVINGDFGVWQRGTSITLGSGALSTYGADRFIFEAYGSSTAATVTRQTFTPGIAPVAGYEGQFFARLTNFASATAWQIRHRIENVQTFAGQTVTFSFWAKASTAITVDEVQAIQNFGSGGSTSVTTSAGGISLTTSWTRFTKTISVPSISGKTIGTSGYLEFTFYQGSGATNSSTIDTWGWQVEAGSTVTAFQTATGTLQGELSACQRYYYLHASGTALSIGNAGYYSATQVNGILSFPVTMRTAPTLAATSGTSYYVADRNGGDDPFNSLTIYRPTTTAAMIYNNTEATGTAGHAALLYTNNASASVAFSAEL